MDDRSSLTQLSQMMQGIYPESALFLKKEGPGARASGLSRRELTMMQAILRGEKIPDIARESGSNISMLYALRLNGLRKLGLNHKAKRLK